MIPNKTNSNKKTWTTFKRLINRMSEIEKYL
jgi:hypothetical protein